MSAHRSRDRRKRWRRPRRSGRVHPCRSWPPSCGQVAFALFEGLDHLPNFAGPFVSAGLATMDATGGSTEVFFGLL